MTHKGLKGNVGDGQRNFVRGGHPGLEVERSHGDLEDHSSAKLTFEEIFFSLSGKDVFYFEEHMAGSWRR